MAIAVESLSELRRVSSLGAPALPCVLLAGFMAEEAGELSRRLEGCCEMETATGPEEARSALAGRPVAVLGLGPLLSPAESRELAHQTPGAAAPLVLLTAAGPDPGLFQDLIDEDRLFYLSLGALPVAELAELIRSALERRPSIAAPKGTVDSSLESPAPAGLRRSLQTARRLAAQPDLMSAGELLQLAVEEAVEADRAYCLLYDPVNGTLWSRGTALEAAERHESAAVGLVSFVARTARPVRIERLSADPRYERDADDPRGGSGERLLAVPVRGAEGKVLAVLSAIRDAGAAPFSATDQEELEVLGATVAPPLAQIELESRLDAEAQQTDRALRAQTSDLFRTEALEHHAAAGSREGDWLRISPHWMGATFWLLAGLVGAFLVYSLFGTVDQYASGPAVVRLSGLKGPAGRPVAVAVATALLPGQHRPLLRVGMPLSLKLPGYDPSPQRLTITAVGETVVGPEEAWRLLGPEVAGAVPLSGPVVLVQARLPGSVFEAGGKRYRLYDGLWGTAEVRLRSEPMLPALVPGLPSVPERHGG